MLFEEILCLKTNFAGAEVELIDENVENLMQPDFEHLL